ncbi:tyrosine-type recombinase/integrase [Pseudomonas putida]|nr:tyrosine-type recombinase/integrase [Pseudomonas putida]
MPAFVVRNWQLVASLAAGSNCSRYQAEHRELDSGPEVYRACDSLQQTISRLYRQAGIKQGSSHSGRRSLAAKVLQATGDVETVQTILGHACLDHSKPYLSVSRETIRRAFQVAL